jgi:hypothetical protein
MPNVAWGWATYAEISNLVAFSFPQARGTAIKCLQRHLGPNRVQLAELLHLREAPMRRCLVLSCLFAVGVFVVPSTAAPTNTPKAPTASRGSQIDAQQAAQIEEMMRLRALQARRGRGGGPKTGAPIILGGGPPSLTPPVAAGEQNNSGTRKSSKERRAEAKAAAAERKRLKKEQAEKVKGAKKGKERPDKKADKIAPLDDPAKNADAK